MNARTPLRPRRRGISLIETMIALAIALVAGLAIVQTMSTYGKQQRIGGSLVRAQNDNLIALAMLERDLNQAGYGLAANRLQNCATFHSSVDGTAVANLSTAAVTIVDGGAGQPDVLRIRFAESVRGGVPLPLASNMSSSTDALRTASSFGVRAGDLVLVTNSANACTLRRITNVNTGTTPHTLTAAATTSPNFNPVSPTGWPTYTTAQNTEIYVLGEMVQRTYSLDAARSRLQVREMLGSDVAIVEGVVDLQAQYGLSTSAASTVVTQWVDATGSWASPSTADRKRIRAIRVALVTAADEADPTLGVQGALVLWPAVSTSGAQASPAVTYTPPAAAAGRRHRVLRTVVPLRNMLWSELT